VPKKPSTSNIRKVVRYEQDLQYQKEFVIFYYINYI